MSVLNKAFELFRGLRKKDVVVYTAMIMGCGINGRDSDAIELFEEMIHSKLSPNLVTFINCLRSCWSGGRRLSLLQFHEKLWTCSICRPLQPHGWSPWSSREVSRSPRFNKEHAYAASCWGFGSLLSACNLHNNVELREIAAKHCFELEPDTTSYRSLLANIYFSAGRWDDAKRLQTAIHDTAMEKGMAKISGSSWMVHSWVKLPIGSTRSY